MYAIWYYNTSYPLITRHQSGSGGYPRSANARCLRIVTAWKVDTNCHVGTRGNKTGLNNKRCNSVFRHWWTIHTVQSGFEFPPTQFFYTDCTDTRVGRFLFVSVECLLVTMPFQHNYLAESNHYTPRDGDTLKRQVCRLLTWLAFVQRATDTSVTCTFMSQPTRDMLLTIIINHIFISDDQQHIDVADGAHSALKSLYIEVKNTDESTR